MDLNRAAALAQILSFPPAFYCAYAIWVDRNVGQSVMDNVTVMWWVAFGVFAGLGMLGIVVSVLSLKARPTTSHTTSARAPIHVLERYYLALAKLREHVRHLNRAAEVSERNPNDPSMYEAESTLEKIRTELMNLSPAVFPTAVALDFQRPQVSYAIDVSKRVPEAIDALMKKVLSQWGSYGERLGITPLRFRESPIVKLDD